MKGLVCEHTLYNHERLENGTTVIVGEPKIETVLCLSDIDASGYINVLFHDGNVERVVAKNIKVLNTGRMPSDFFDNAYGLMFGTRTDIKINNT